jgi:epoxyqueuosine reductase
MELTIREKALELGYETCGIVPISEMDGYDEKLKERMIHSPGSVQFYERQKRLTRLREQYPWARSVVVAVSPYGHYRVPGEVQDRVGKYYLFDSRVNQESAEYQRTVSMDAFLVSIGLKVLSDAKFGIVGVRWAAMQAGLGIIRRNNFFYSKSGSWVTLDAWLTDREMKLTDKSDLPPCPNGCDRCVRACPTGSLSAPYLMAPERCVSFLTTFGGRDLANNPLAPCFGDWVYGCDACQDACPMNRGKWTEEDDFPGIAELAQELTGKSIMEMNDIVYRQRVQPKFFYLSPDDRWKWKVNTLNCMRNRFKEEYRPIIMKACEDENEKVRAMACAVSRELPPIGEGNE